MNESEFETELRALRPASPSPALARRIAAEMPSQQALAVAASRTLDHAPASGVVAQPRRSAWGGLLRGMLWATGGAAAAALFLLSRAPQPPPLTSPGIAANNEAPALTATADETVSELIGAADDGLVFDENSAEPQRQMRFTYIERHIWTNQQTGAVIEFEVPREDIVLMPVAMQ